MAFISIFFFSSMLLLLNTKVKIISRSPSPIGFLIALAVFVQIVPGIVLVSFYDFPMSYGLHSAISKDTLYFTFWFTMCSLGILFLLLYLTSFIINYNVNLHKLYVARYEFYWLSIASCAIMAVKIMSVGDIPFLMTLFGDATGAAEQKARILKGEVGAGGFLIGYLFGYLHYVALAYAYLCYKKHVINKYEFFSFLAFLIFYMIYDMQKLNFVFFLIFIYALNAMFDGVKLVRLFFVFLMVLILLVSSFMLLHESALQDVLIQVAARAFIGQMEGSYMIYEVLEPDLQRIYYGAPLGFIFNYPPITDPAADVVKIFFPDVGDAWVNSNTFILAHAWSIFGFISVFLAPLAIVINILLFAILRDVFSRYIGSLAVCVYFTMVLTLRINNDYSFFLYGRSLVSFGAVAVFLICLKLLMITFHREKR